MEAYTDLEENGMKVLVLQNCTINLSLNVCVVRFLNLWTS